jgi:peptide/nickel transport system permease protein
VTTVDLATGGYLDRYRAARAAAGGWFGRSRTATGLSLLLLALLLVCAIRPSLFVAGDPLAIHPDRVMQAPSWSHVFGTDEYGRDMLAQIIYGARTSLEVALAATAISSVTGTVIGALSGYWAGLADSVIMRLLDIALCFPGILLALLFQAALGPGTSNEVFAVAVAAVPAYARLARGQALSLRSRPYLVAARSAGVREPVVVVRHVLPGVLAPAVSLATIGIGSSVVLAASLSFLGLGSQNGHPDWGRLIGDGRNYLGTAWWIATFPGLVITVLVVCAATAGDRLQHRLAGRSR